MYMHMYLLDFTYTHQLFPSFVSRFLLTFSLISYHLFKLKTKFIHIVFHSSDSTANVLPYQ